MGVERLCLRAGDLQVELVPSIGGAIAHFSHAGVSVMRETPPAATDVRLFSCYPLVPFSNRIAGGRFTYAGRSHRLGRHPLTGSAHAIHGEGWMRHWEVVEANQSSARLVVMHGGTEPGSWPFPWRAEQHIVATGNELTISLSLTNIGGMAAPAGIGLHPYFPRHGGVKLRFQAEEVWQNGTDHLPAKRGRVPDTWNFSLPRMLEEPGLDNCFAGWSGTATISWLAIGRSLTISADACFGHAVVFTPAGQDYFAFEPVSHMNDAINRMGTVPDHGLVVLPSGARLAGTVRFSISSSVAT